MGKVILVASGSGGSGKTTLAVNIASLLAVRGHKSIVLDLNVGLRNSDIYMGLENGVVFDLGDVVSGVCTIDKAIVQSLQYDGLSLMCSPQSKGIEGFGNGHIKALYSLLTGMYDYVIVDSPAGLGASFTAAASSADKALIVLTPDYISLRSADAVDRCLDAYGIKSRFFVINKLDQGTWGDENLPDLEHIVMTLSCPLAGVIQYDSKIHIANNKGISIAVEGDEYLNKVFSSIADYFEK